MFTTRLTGLLLCFSLVVACGGGGNDNANNGGDGLIKLRVVHASSDAGPVDIYVSGAASTIVEDFDYGATTPFLDVPAGNYNIDVRPAGADPATAPVFSVSNVPLAAGIEALTIVAAGLVGQPSGSGQEFRLLTLVHDFDVPAADRAIVRIVHASPTAPAVKVDVGDDGFSEVQLLDRFADTGATGIPLPSGQELQVGIRVASTDDRVTAFTTPALPAGAELFVIATGLLSQQPDDADGFSLLAVAPSGSIGFIRQNPIVYALHAGPNAPPVQVFSGTAQLTETIAFGEWDTIQVPPGTYPLALVNPSDDSTALSGQSPALAAGEVWLATARGFLSGNNALELSFARDEFGRDDATALARVIHSSPDAPTVELGIVDAGVFSPLGLPALSYGQESGPVGVPIGTDAFVLGLRVAGQQDAAVTFNLAPNAGERLIAVAIGSLLDGTAEPFALAVVNAATNPWTLQIADPIVQDDE